MVLLLKERATREQMMEMLRPLRTYIKLAVDIERDVLAGGGVLHADCEAVLLETGSEQTHIWGASWLPSAQEVGYESLINIRPRQGNLSLEISDAAIRHAIDEIVRRLLEGVSYE